MLRFQAATCRGAGSTLYGSLLERAAADHASGGPVAAVLAGHEADPLGSALPLRFLGAVHRLVLQGRLPGLAPYYPSVGGDAGAGDAWPAFRDALATHTEELRFLLPQPVQTNEVGRTAALAPVLLTVAARAGLPLRLLEVGCSAGLNLRWDRFRYVPPQGPAWGDPESRLCLTSFAAAVPPFAGPRGAVVLERRGCDPNPIDPTTPDGRVTLRSFVWPDQRDRLARLDAAIEVAGLQAAGVERHRGAPWLAGQLAEPWVGVATVVYHSIVLQYLSRAERDALVGVVRSAGSRARADRPLAWVRFEPGPVRDRADVHLTYWPGGTEELLARSGFHGQAVEWLGG